METKLIKVNVWGMILTVSVTFNGREFVKAIDTDDNKDISIGSPAYYEICKELDLKPKKFTKDEIRKVEEKRMQVSNEGGEGYGTEGTYDDNTPHTKDDAD